MATTYTENFKFGKQEEKSNKFSMDVINQNMDDIDKYLGQATVKLDKTAATATAAQSEAAINRTTLGFESYNLCNATEHTETTANGVTYSAAGGHFVANGTTTGSFTVYATRTEIYATEDLWIHPATTLANVTYHARVLRVDGTSNYPSIGTNGLKISAGETIKDIYIQQSASGKTVEADIYVMVTPLTLKDKPFIPYADNVDERLKAVESDTGWVDCLPSITAESFALDTEYSNVAKIRRVGKYVSLRATLKFISDGNDGHVRGFLHNMVPEGYRPSDMLFAIMNYGKYNSPTSATYKVLSAQVNSGDLTLFLNDGGTVADLYGYIVRINMDWLLG